MLSRWILVTFAANLLLVLGSYSLRNDALQTNFLSGLTDTELTTLTTNTVLIRLNSTCFPNVPRLLQSNHYAERFGSKWNILSDKDQLSSSQLKLLPFRKNHNILLSSIYEDDYHVTPKKALDLILNYVYKALNNSTSNQLMNNDVELEYLENVEILLVRTKHNSIDKDVLLNALSQVPCMKGQPTLEKLRVPDKNTYNLNSIRINNANSLQATRSFQLPNDPMLSDQWYLYGKSQGEDFGINAISAWASILSDFSDHKIGDSVQYDVLTRFLKPITVAVVDSGCTNHNDLVNSFAYNPNCSTSQITYVDPMTGKQEGCFGYSFGDDSPDPTHDVANHGTAAGGLIAASPNNNYGIAGACPTCRLVCLNIVDSATGKISTSSIVKSIDYIIKHKIPISNHSYGGFGMDLNELHAFEKLDQTGKHLAFTAAGNARCNLGCQDSAYCPRKCPGSELWTPALFPVSSLVVIGSIERNGRVSSFSNVGDKAVHLFAPGNNIVSLSNHADKKFVMLSGTSFSSPIAAAAGALLWSAVPQAKPSQIKEALMYGAKQHSHLKYYGIIPGVIDVQRAYKFLKNKFKNEEAYE